MEENLFVCSGVVILYLFEVICVRDEFFLLNFKMIWLSFDSSVMDDLWRKCFENIIFLVFGEGFCSSCIFEGFIEDVDDDVFELVE